MYLHHLKSVDEIFRQKQVFIVSLGSVEQHGMYGPLGTDYLIQQTLIEKVEHSLPEVVFLPTTPFGPCWQQLGFPGSVSLQESTLLAILNDIVESLKDFSDMILFVSWHGGNKPVIEQYLSEKSSDYPDIHMDQITFGDEGTDVEAEKLLHGPPDDHAGNTEVALMLAINPTITQQPNSDDKKTPNSTFEWDRRIKEVQPDGVIDEHPRWVATPEIGEKLIAIYSDNLANKIRSKLLERTH